MAGNTGIAWIALYKYLVFDCDLWTPRNIMYWLLHAGLPLLADVSTVPLIQVLVTVGLITCVRANLVLVCVPPHAALDDGLVGHPVSDHGCKVREDCRLVGRRGVHAEPLRPCLATLLDKGYFFDAACHQWISSVGFH